jgi:hypothetical protein
MNAAIAEVRKHHALTQAEVSPTDQGSITRFYANEQYGIVPPQQPIAVIGSGFMKKKLEQLVSLFDRKQGQRPRNGSRVERLTGAGEACGLH